MEGIGAWHGLDARGVAFVLEVLTHGALLHVDAKGVGESLWSYGVEDDQ